MKDALNLPGLRMYFVAQLGRGISGLGMTRQRNVICMPYEPPIEPQETCKP